MCTEKIYITHELWNYFYIAWIPLEISSNAFWSSCSDDIFRTELWQVSLPFLRPVPGSEYCEVSDDGPVDFGLIAVLEEDWPEDEPLLGFFRRVEVFGPAVVVSPSAAESCCCWCFVLFSVEVDDLLGESAAEAELARLDPLGLSDLFREGDSRGKGESEPVENRFSWTDTPRVLGAGCWSTTQQRKTYQCKPI